MNNKKNIFHQSTDNKRFQERHVEAKPTSKHATSRPTHNKKRPATASYTEKTSSEVTQTIWNTQLRKAGQSGTVQVHIKSNQDTPHEKKTGPLSPRAPEKIRKNRAEEMKVYGENACLTLFSQRPEAIVRAWATVEMSHKIGHLFSYLAKHKKAYHVVDNKELTLVSGTEHHGGICMLVKKPTPFTLSGYLAIAKEQDCLVLLDNVRNAYNIGGLVRTCAFYGVKGIIVDNVELLNSASATRIAEGGMEYIHPLETPNTEIALQQLRQAGYQIVHISHNKQAGSLAKVRFKNKIVFVLSETSSEALAAPQDTQVALSTVNPLKHGLNVTVAAGVLLATWYQH
ncbi:tRNA/rRNA methyltransferase [Conservatibacter flavescens]|uniref:tRNA/rRNA methyltransferase n=1 Tax=Conservatibacter flavescens TaxID=28161 RepID=A0A2M8S1G1_9PAST|nr:tRNA/rRNA methyltransferase [Conservatibacter flavescens]PJG84944.1 tRNA/rRNA methyltransferase [Conservatibacter flavescens]